MAKIGELFGSKPGMKPQPMKGFYTALAIFLPLIILTVLGRSPFGVLVMFGALVTAFGDVSTSPRVQAWSLGTVAVSGAIMTGLGRIISGPWWLEITELFLVVLLGGLLTVYGRVMAAMGLLVTITLVLSLANSDGPTTALPAAGGFLLGGAILLLFALTFTWLLSLHRNTPGNKVQVSPSRSALATLTAQLTWSSPLLRLCFLRALGASVAVGIGWLLGGPYPYWAALTVITCARANQQTSLKLTAQDVVATFLGALLANVVIAGVQSVLIIGLIVVLVAFLAFTYKDLNYTLFVFFLTNLILLLLSIKTSGHSFALWRVFAILLGGAIVLAITFLDQALAELFNSPNAPDIRTHPKM